MIEDDLIEHYLRDVRASLVTSDGRRDRVLAEIEGHLRDSAAVHAADGSSPGEAAALAIQEFGPSDLVAAGFTDDVDPPAVLRGVRRWLPLVLPVAALVPSLAMFLYGLVAWVPGDTSPGERIMVTIYLRSALMAGALTFAAHYAIRRADHDPAWRWVAWACPAFILLRQLAWFL